MKTVLLYAGLCVITGLSLAWGAQPTKDLTRTRRMVWASPPARFDIGDIGEEATVELEFSQDGRYVCGRCLPQKMGHQWTTPGTNVVLDLGGRPVAEATDKDGQLVGRYVSMFPGIAWRRRFASFVKDGPDYLTTMWGFTRDFSAGIRVLKPKEKHLSPVSVEFWRFEPSRTNAWSVSLPEETSTSGSIDFLDREGQSCVLIAFGHTRAYVLSLNDGKVVQAFTYGRQDTKDSSVAFEEEEAERVAYKRRFHLPGDADDWGFAACQFAFDAGRGLLACGDGLNSSRLRVFSIGPPREIVFEGNWDLRPNRPWGGAWYVLDLRFGGGGRYLIATYGFSGRLTLKCCEPVEVFDTKSWEVIWWVNDPDKRPGTTPEISPDGTMMALVRGTVIEMGRFVPAADSSPTGVKKR